MASPLNIKLCLQEHTKIIGVEMSDIKSIVVLESGFGAREILPSQVLTIAIISLIVIIGLYVLRSVGLFTLAKKQNLKSAWLSFIPFVWIYVPAKVMGTIVLGRKPVKNFAIIVTVVFALTEIISFVITFLANFPLIGYYLQGGKVYIASLETYNESIKAMGFLPYIFSGSIYVKGIVYPYNNLILLNTILTILSSTYNILSLVSVVLTVLVYIGLFRKFWPSRYVLATVLSVIGFFPIMAFVIRNKKAINFNEYMRSRYYGHGFNPYGGAYPNGMNTNSTSQQSSTTAKQPPNPFEEFDNAEDKSDPFGFNDKQ